MPRDVGAEYDRYLAGTTPFSLYMRWALQHQRATNIRPLLGSVEPGVQGRVLDVGCGCGVYLDAAHRLGHGRELLAGVDLSARQVRYTAERLRRVAGPNAEVQVRQSSATDLPFEDQSFDLVMSHAMTQYLDDESLAAFLLEARRVLAPGGWLTTGAFARSVAPFRLPPEGLMGCPPGQFRSADVQAEHLRRIGFDQVRTFPLRRFLRIPLTIEGAAGRNAEG